MTGFLLVDKPVGLVSFKTVSRIRHLTREKRVGFAGTLDPFASGLLVMAIGRQYTRQLDTILALPKTYTMTMVFGIETDTLDPEGIITQTQPFVCPSLDQIEACLQTFTGDILQMPPQFSAKKINGKAAYHFARAGQEVDLKPSSVTIYGYENVRIIDAPNPQLACTITCSKGTYIRSLARDIAAYFGTVGHVTQLRRDAVGTFHVEQSLPYDELTTESIPAHLFREIGDV
jgi:tRNA pseudouridine55 synthase